MNPQDFDSRLDEALGELPAPAHRPGFLDELAAQIDAEPAPGRAAVAPKVSHRRRYLFGLATPVAAAGLAIALAVNMESAPMSGPTGEIAQPPSSVVSIPIENLSAREVLARATTTYASVQGVRAKFDLTENPSVFQVGNTQPGIRYTGELVYLSSGSYVLRYRDEQGVTFEESYDSAKAEQVRLYDGAAKNDATAIRTTGIDPSRMTSPFQSIGGAVGWSEGLWSAANSDEVELEEVTHDGAPAWQVSTKLPAHEPSGRVAATMQMVIDKTSTFPVSVRTTIDGKLAEHFEVRDLVINPRVTDKDMRIAIPNGLAVETTDAGYRRVDLSRVEGIAAYKPIVPDFVPAGYELSAVAVAKDAGAGGPEGLNPQNKDVVSLTYRRGLEVMSITTRRVGSPTLDWLDPNAYEGEVASRESEVTLTKGAFEGTKVEVVGQSTQQPRLFGVGSKLVLTVQASLSADDLVKVAESLQVRGS